MAGLMESRESRGEWIPEMEQGALMEVMESIWPTRQEDGQLQRILLNDTEAFHANVLVAPTDEQASGLRPVRYIYVYTKGDPGDEPYLTHVEVLKQIPAGHRAHIVAYEVAQLIDDEKELARLEHGIAAQQAGYHVFQVMMYAADPPPAT